MLSLTALMGFLLFSGTSPLHAEASEAPRPPAYTVTLTAYNAVEAQTDDDPLETASGAYANPEVIAARSQDLADTLPFGTIVEFDAPRTSQESCGYRVVAPRVGYRVIADSMNARYTGRVDILFGTEAEYATQDKGMKNAAEVLGVCTGITMRVVGFVDINHIPHTQTELAAFVTGRPQKLALNK